MKYILLFWPFALFANQDMHHGKSKPEPLPCIDRIEIVYHVCLDKAEALCKQNPFCMLEQKEKCDTEKQQLLAQCK